MIKKLIFCYTFCVKKRKRKKMKKIVTVALALMVVAMVTACTSSGSNLEKQTPSFQAGAKDGCATASGEYTKNSTAFNNDSEYHNGWFHGRKKCNPSQ